jgi:2-keto-4-pentenoate hydratase/2-oxohepta-3-ene-1,7-dioic acid hydratase in catechol pathway
MAMSERERRDQVSYKKQRQEQHRQELPRINPTGTYLVTKDEIDPGQKRVRVSLERDNRGLGYFGFWLLDQRQALD